MSLASLIDDPQKALATWPVLPKFYHRDPASFERLLTPAQVAALIDNECLARQYLAVFKDGGKVDPRAYSSDDHLMPRRGSMRRFLDQGHTVSLRGLQKLLPPVAGLCADLATETGCVVHANAYYTPAGHSGLRYHYDPYVTLVVQLAGRKVWPIHPPMVDNPVREYLSFTDMGFSEKQLEFLANTAPPIERELAPGDVLWLPRGFVHAPYAVGDEPSLHLTFALKQRTPHWVASQLAARSGGAGRRAARFRNAGGVGPRRAAVRDGDARQGRSGFPGRRAAQPGRGGRRQADTHGGPRNHLTTRPATRRRGAGKDGKLPLMPPYQQADDIDWDDMMKGPPVPGIHWHGFFWKGSSGLIYSYKNQAERTPGSPDFPASDVPPRDDPPPPAQAPTGMGHVHGRHGGGCLGTDSVGRGPAYGVVQEPR